MQNYKLIQHNEKFEFGYTKIIPLDWPIMMEFGILKLNSGDSQQFNEDDLETALIILSGRGEISIPSVSDETFSINRKEVFDEPTTSFLIPKHHKYIVSSYDNLELAVLKAKDEGSEFLVRYAEDINLDHFGDEANNSRRRVFEYFGDNNAPKSNIVVGEFLSEEGGHTSVGPDIGGAHKHPQWEIYHKRLQPEDGYTWLGIGAETFYGFNNTTTLLPGNLPHPQTAGYGIKEWNLWSIRHKSGEGKQRWTRASCRPVKISEIR